MIKVAGRHTDGRPILLLGLSGENMTRLMADEPMVIETDKLGAPFSGLPDLVIIVVGGRTEDDIAAMVRALSTGRAPL